MGEMGVEEGSSLGGEQTSSSDSVCPSACTRLLLGIKLVDNDRPVRFHGKYVGKRGGIRVFAMSQRGTDEEELEGIGASLPFILSD